MPYLIYDDCEFSPVDEIESKNIVKLGFGRVQAHRVIEVIAHYQNNIEDFSVNPRTSFTRDELVCAGTRNNIYCVASEKVVDKLILQRFLLDSEKNPGYYELNVIALWNESDDRRYDDFYA